MSSTSAQGRERRPSADEEHSGASDDNARPDTGNPAEQSAEDGRNESKLERLDRNIAEMVQEMRVGAVGIQVLFAFLLVVPFNTGWKQTTRFDHDAYFVTLSCIAIATALLIAPSIHHRILFRHGEKPYLVRTGNQLMIVAMVFEAAGLVGILTLVSHVVFGGVTAAVAGALTAIVIGWLWFGIPLARRARTSSELNEE
jgi:hypothetical protein